MHLGTPSRTLPLVLLARAEEMLIDARTATAITQAEAEKAAARMFGADSRLNVVRIADNERNTT